MSLEINAIEIGDSSRVVAFSAQADITQNRRLNSIGPATVGSW
jgi:hypothetical protein